MLSSEFLAILACPKCQGGINHDQANSGIICAKCQLIYPIREEIPIMIIEEAQHYQAASENISTENNK